MTKEYKQKWKCPACYCRMPKVGNENTPVRTKDHTNIGQNKSPDADNITIRKKSVTQNNDSICSLSTENTTFLGDDTVNFNSMKTTLRPELTLQSLSEVITQKLQENNINVISQLQNIIQKEVKEAIQTLKEEFKQEINNLNDQNRNRILEIQELNLKIDNLQKEKKLLKIRIEDLEKTFNCITEKKYPENPDNARKKIVLYGLDEYYKEPESHLITRIHELFWNLMGVDSTGYIEDLYRIGRHNKNGKRPLVIEFISKRIVKHITENSYSLKQSGLSVSEFLDKTSLMKRKIMREEMLLSRQKGLHAVIRNNQLYIEGKFIDIDDISTQANFTSPANIGQETEIEKQGRTTNINFSQNSRQSHGNNHSFRK